MLPSVLMLVLACEPDPVAVDDDGDGDGVPASADCRDDDAFVYPGALERCNGVDDDCDGVIDGPAAAGGPRWLVDGDGDGFGAGSGITSCVPVEGHVQAGGDCDDADPTVHPGALDGCDGVDTDCNGLVDDAPDQIGYPDGDGDGFGKGTATKGCLGVDIAAVDGDCNDRDATESPAGVEDCTPGDEDCDGYEDDDDFGGAEGGTLYYADVDGDGFGDDTRSAMSCAPPTDRVSLEPGDCDDSDDSVFPGAVELCAGVDQDCDGALPSDDAWFDPALAARVPVTVDLAVADPAVPVAIVLSRAELDAVGVVSPEEVTAVVQDCATAPRVLAAQLSDTVGDPFGPTPLALGPDDVAVHLLLDEGVAGPQQLALYFGGGEAPSAPASAAADTLAWSGQSARFDPQRGGLLDDLDGPVGLVASAADVEGEQGVRTTGWLTGTGEVEVVEDGPVLAAIERRATRAEGGLQVDQSELWFAYGGRDELFVSMAWGVAQGGVVQAVLPLRVTVPGAEGGAVVSGVGWAGREGAASLALGWLQPPVAGAVGCDASACEAQGSDATGAVTAGDTLLDDRVLFLQAFEGPVDVPAIEASLRLAQRPTLTIGAAEEGP